MKIFRTLFLLFAIVSVASAQNSYFVRDADESAVSITVQQTASGQNHIRFEFVEAHCEAAYTLTIRRDGTTATATASTPSKLNGWEPASTATAYIDSDVGSGTLIDTKEAAAGQTIVVNLDGIDLARGGGATDNFTVSVTGDCKLFLRWNE